MGDVRGALCWVLLQLGLRGQGLEVVEDVRGGLGLRCLPGAALGLGLRWGSGFGPWWGTGFWWLLGGGLGWWRGFGLRRGGGLEFGPDFAGVRCRPALQVAGFGAARALAVSGAPAVGMGFGGPRGWRCLRFGGWGAGCSCAGGGGRGGCGGGGCGVGSRGDGRANSRGSPMEWEVGETDVGAVPGSGRRGWALFARCCGY